MRNSALWIVLQKMRIPFLVIVLSYTISMVGLLIIDGVDTNGNPYEMSIFDTFYLVTYTATTIGFGETPYEFVYSQRMWVSVMIYISVISWFYAIGTLVSLLQDKIFLAQIAQSKFKRQINSLQEPFVIILGYNYTTSEIIKIINETDNRVVVIEKQQEKVDTLILENFTPHIPVLKANSYDSQTLELAGIKSKYCKAVVSLYKSDELNLRIALSVKMLNSNVVLAVKSTTDSHTENLKDLGVEIVENPFKIISSHIKLALTAPNVLKLERWIYQIGLLDDPLLKLPKGKYIVCGFGRMGQAIHKVFKANDIECEFIELDKSVPKYNINTKNLNLHYGDSDDKDMLKYVDIYNCVGIIAGTNDDTVNISILKTAKKLNPKIITIARENHIEDFSIFKNANIDQIFIPGKILINKTTNALIKPSADKFIRHLSKKDESWAVSLVTRLIKNIDKNPMLHVIYLVKDEAPAIIDKIEDNHKIKLNVFKKSLSNRNISNNVVPLMIYNTKDKKEILLPSWDEILRKNDKILFACDNYANDEMEYIAQNIYELHYILYGVEKSKLKLNNKGI